jgi:hypothetical protein
MDGNEHLWSWEQAMSKSWQYQIRLYLAEPAATTARDGIHGSSLVPLMNILDAHNAALVNQLAAFEDYVVSAEKEGTENFPLYKWTKAVVSDPEKRMKYAKTFTLQVSNQEVYEKDIADALEADLRPLVGSGLITSLSRHDTNPENNPQIPPRYRS